MEFSEVRLRKHNGIDRSTLQWHVPQDEDDLRAPWKHRPGVRVSNADDVVFEEEIQRFTPEEIFSIYEGDQSLRVIPVHERGRPSKRLVLCGLRRCGLETACSRLIRTWRRLEDEVSDLRNVVRIRVMALERRVRELECRGADPVTRFPL